MCVCGGGYSVIAAYPREEIMNLAVACGVCPRRTVHSCAAFLGEEGDSDADVRDEVAASNGWVLVAGRDLHLYEREVGTSAQIFGVDSVLCRSLHKSPSDESINRGVYTHAKQINYAR